MEAVSWKNDYTCATGFTVETTGATISHGASTRGVASLDTAPCAKTFASVSADFNDLLGDPVVRAVETPPDSVDGVTVTVLEEDGVAAGVALWDPSTLESCETLVAAKLEVTASWTVEETDSLVKGDLATCTIVCCTAGA